MYLVNYCSVQRKKPGTIREQSSPPTLLRKYMHPENLAVRSTIAVLRYNIHSSDPVNTLRAIISQKKICEIVHLYEFLLTYDIKIGILNSLGAFQFEEALFFCVYLIV